MPTFGKGLMILGGFIFVIGGLIFTLSRSKIPFGQLPGDIQFRFGSFTCLIPLATSIFLSIFLTVLLNFLVRFLNR